MMLSSAHPAQRWIEGLVERRMSLAEFGTRFAASRGVMPSAGPRSAAGRRRVADKKATGILGTGPLDIITEHREGQGSHQRPRRRHDLRLRGQHEGPQSKIGQCLYDLNWNGKAYEGTRGCGNSAEPVTVSVPTTLGKWSDAELGVCLGLLMGKPSSAQVPGVKMRTTNTTPIDQAGAHPTVGSPRGEQ